MNNTVIPHKDQLAIDPKIGFDILHQHAANMCAITYSRAEETEEKLAIIEASSLMINLIEKIKALSKTQ